jgi:acyl carrier protein
MTKHQDLKLIPDWSRLRQLVAKHLDTSEEKVQAMRDGGDSLNQVELRMAIEEVLEKLSR